MVKMLDFNFEIYFVYDGKFGIKKENGEWNGMIGEFLVGVIFFGFWKNCYLIFFLFMNMFIKMNLFIFLECYYVGCFF